MPIEITKDQISSFRKMVLSEDEKDIEMAWDILKGRDQTDPESEKNYMTIFKDIKILELEEASEVWVIKFNGKVLLGNKDKVGFSSKQSASSNFTMLLNNIHNHSYHHSQDEIGHHIQNKFKTITEFKRWLVKEKVVEFVQMNLNGN